MYYDSKGNFKVAGYEALTEEMTEKATTEEWVKLEWSAGISHSSTACSYQP